MATAPLMALDPVEAFEATEPQLEQGLDVRELATVLQREHEAAQSEYERQRDMHDLSWRYYEAKPFGNEDDGRSQIVLPDVQETVDYMSTSVLRTFVSGDRVVEFEATDEVDEEAVDQATAAIGFNFMRQQDGYRVLHDWCVSGLVERYGIAKTMMITEERVMRDKVTITDPVELENADGEIEDVAEQQDGTLLVTIKRQKREKRFVDLAVPANEFRFSPNARHEDDADYLAHCPAKTRSELVDMGFDRDQVYGLPAYTKVPGEDRDEYWPEAESSPALEQVLLCEEYARIDIDGDGVAERVKVFRVEDQILKWADGELAIETVEEQPFAVFCPFPRPHRLVGWSLADKVMDVQLVRSTIARQLFDGMNNANMPRPIVSEAGASENTIDDLLSPVAGSPIRVRDTSAVTPYVTAFDIGKSMGVLEWMSREGQARSGTPRAAQMLDPDKLNTQTATEYAGDREDGQSRQEFVARNLAEALSRLMAKKYRLMRREADPFRAKVDGKYVQVDPASWPEEMNVVIRVGLGTGSKDKRIQARMMLAPLLAEGFQSQQVKPKHLFHAIDGLVRDLGIGQGDDFWVNPDAPPDIDPQTGQPVQEQEQPDPEQMAAHAEMQREQQKMEFEQQKAAATHQLQQEQAAAQIQLEREKASAQLEAQRESHALQMEQKREAAALEADLAQRKAETEAQIAIYRIDREAEVKRYAASRNAPESDDIGQNRPGGALDA